MIGVENIEEWRGQKVLDRDGVELGKLEDVYFDEGSDTPLLIAIKSGLLGRRSSLVPIEDARVGPDYIRVAYPKETVEQATGRSGDGVPAGEDLRVLGSAYGLAFADRVTLASAGERANRRAEAAAARERADQLEAEAQQKLAARETAHSRVEGASEAATAAEREAEDARAAAIEARQTADRYEQD